ncbi:hypothetical protein OXPF_28240 [Oxobacter pfennigii]|uniref:DUF2383 domain-containing protein n=1 Tax=Oxobacter pfennigii TaxID=36849 RepID=A0A0P8YUK8_9CLOT|nr:hypothetical protein [Oxobacter pfennigii]KPU43383.1 hypothetical protein OXPF_28240 [Oxobacter pfennigii]
MSCSVLKKQFEDEINRGITFERTMEFYNDVKGSIDAHRIELAQLKQSNSDPNEIHHLQEHIEEGEQLLNEIKSLSLTLKN